MTDSHIPDRLVAALADRYRLERKLGEGGMASVYLAEDLKHSRRVAIKVLRPELAAVIGGERFLAEIRTTANLQHPHILPLFDSGQADGFLYYVMPYVEGESLEGRLHREKQLPTADAVRLTQDIAEALDYAHRQGIVHRDIKPANILLQEGRPLVADFGIALAVSAAGAGRMTETGLSLGTPHYMSPEQASADRDLDPRSDIYSLGCMLYEMLVGEPPYTGPSAQSILVKILTGNATPVTDQRPTVPPNVSDAVARAVEKLPADRFSSAAEFAAALNDPAFRHETARRGSGAVATGLVGGPAETAPRGDPRLANTRQGLPRAAGAALAMIAVGALAFGVWASSRPTPEQPTVHASLDMGRVVPSDFAHIEISPDGQYLVVAADTVGAESRRSLYIRRVDEPEFRLLITGSRPAWPVFSPDSRWVAFAETTNDGSFIRKVPVGGGSTVTLLAKDGQVGGPNELAWGEDGFIYYYEWLGATGQISRIAGDGGDPEVVLADAPWAFDPEPLPNGRGLLMLDTRPNPNDLVLHDMERDTTLKLVSDARSGVYVEAGYLLFVRPELGLQAVPFDPETYQLLGTPRPVREDVTGWDEYSQISIARNGTLVYASGRASRGGESMVFKEYALDGGEDELVPLSPRDLERVRYSPDGERILFAADLQGSDDSQLFLYDLTVGAAPRQLTIRGDHEAGDFSPDGRSIVFGTWYEEQNQGDLFTLDLNRDTPPVQITFTDSITEYSPDWVDDETILLSRQTRDNTISLWTVDPTGGRDPEPYMQVEGRLQQPQVSPDGRYAAYWTSEFGAPEIVARRFPDPGEVTRISQGRGFHPQWTPDGRSIYYLGPDPDAGLDRMALRRAFLSIDPVLRVDSIQTVLSGLPTIRQWDLHPDGDRAIMIQTVDRQDSGGATADNGVRHVIVVNWLSDLLRRMEN